MKLIASNSIVWLFVTVNHQGICSLHNKRFMSQGERGILSEARNERKALDKGRKMPRSPRVAHKAPVMQARNLPSDICSTKNNIPFPLFHSRGVWHSARKFLGIKSKTFKRRLNGA